VIFLSVVLDHSPTVLAVVPTTASSRFPLHSPGTAPSATAIRSFLPSRVSTLMRKPVSHEDLNSRRGLSNHFLPLLPRILASQWRPTTDTSARPTMPSSCLRRAESAYYRACSAGCRRKSASRSNPARSLSGMSGRRVCGDGLTASRGAPVVCPAAF
jgi:hypothetical protein